MNSMLTGEKLAQETVGAGSVLPQIAQALDSEFMRPRLDRLLSERHGEEISIIELSAKVVRIKPARRCLIQYDLTYHSADELQAVKVLGKVRSRGADHRTYELCRKLWHTTFGASADDSVQVPQPLGLIPELNMWLQYVVDAEPLQSHLDSLNADSAFYSAGAALFELHTRGPMPDRTHGRGDEISVLAEQLRSVAGELSYYSGRIQRILDACEALIESLPHCTSVPIHRDFYPDQVLYKSGSVWLLDFDLYTSGDPALDLGNFVAHLQEVSLRRFGRSYRYSHLEHAFLAGYRNASGKDLSLSVPAFTTLTLARHIAISRRNRARHHTTSALIQICEGRLNLAGVSAAVRSNSESLAIPGWAV